MAPKSTGESRRPRNATHASPARRPGACFNVRVEKERAPERAPDRAPSFRGAKSFEAQRTSFRGAPNRCWIQLHPARWEQDIVLDRRRSLKGHELLSHEHICSSCLAHPCSSIKHLNGLSPLSRLGEGPGLGSPQRGTLLLLLLPAIPSTHVATTLFSPLRLQPTCDGLKNPAPSRNQDTPSCLCAGPQATGKTAISTGPMRPTCQCHLLGLTS